MTQGAPIALRGVLIYAAALMFFACVDGTTKLLAAHHPVPMIAALRYFTQTALLFAILPRSRRALLITPRPALTLARSLSLVLVTIFMGLALARLPLAEATAIGFLAPILVSLLSSPLLGERLTPIKVLAVLGGFVGVLMIVRPGLGVGHLDMLGVLFGFGAALCNTAYQLLSRLLSNTPPMGLLYHSVVVGAVAFGLMLPFSPLGAAPDWHFALLVLLLASVATIGHGLLAYAFRQAPASLLAPLTYLQLLWAGVYGYFVFQQFPDHLSLLGMLIIAVSGVAVALKGRVRS